MNPKTKTKKKTLPLQDDLFAAGNGAKISKEKKSAKPRLKKVSAAEIKRLKKAAEKSEKITQTTITRNSDKPFPVVIKKEVAPGIIQVTLPDRRWYFQELGKKGEYAAYPSITWILDAALPKGYGFNRWLSNLSAEEAKRILETAGERGTRVHAGIEALLRGQKLDFNSPHQFINNECFTADEWQLLMNFERFAQRFRPLVQSVEMTVINAQYGFAGTADLIGIFDEGLLETFNSRTTNGHEANGRQVTAVVDWKTSSAIHESHKMQVMAYAKTLKVDYAIICRLGANNKNGFELFIAKVDDQEQPRYFETFLHVLEVFKFLHAGETPDFAAIKETISLMEENGNGNS